MVQASEEGHPEKICSRAQQDLAADLAGPDAAMALFVRTTGIDDFVAHDIGLIEIRARLHLDEEAGSLPGLVFCREFMVCQQCAVLENVQTTPCKVGTPQARPLSSG